MLRLLERAREKQVGVPALRSTDYINSIPPEREPWFPGDEEIERRIRAFIRWNAAVTVSSANRKGLEVGGPYTVTARALGFRRQPVEQVMLPLGQMLELDFALAPIAAR